MADKNTMINTVALMPECDLIMKGGITSGVVYPKAITTLARKYRLKSIGGSSAGAIGAAIASAAEYRRQTNEKKSSMEGFDIIDHIPKDIGGDILSLFQPSPSVSPLFRIFQHIIYSNTQKNKILSLVYGIFEEYNNTIVTIYALFATLVFFSILTIFNTSWWLLLAFPIAAVFGIFFGTLLSAIVIARRLYRMAFHDLRKNYFGLCTGLTQNGQDRLALTDWMHSTIETIAGNVDIRKKPLLIGDLRSVGIELASITTDLSTQRPYQLPFSVANHLFSKSEFSHIFPAEIVNYLVDAAPSGPHGIPNEYGLTDLYELPVSSAFPVLLVARMSLSFPGLISAVPLYRLDKTLLKATPGLEQEQKQLKRCLFSDGGISSNFPIHFFDVLLPRRPTFGITLTEYSQERHGKERIGLRADGGSSDHLPVQAVDGVLSFVMSIVNSAKDWQDTLQSLLTGYAERIVQIRLSSEQGGMNLNMDAKEVDKIAAYGDAAAKLLMAHFDFDEHRYRRATLSLSLLQESLEGIARNYNNTPPHSKTYEEILVSHEASAYVNSPKWRTQVLEPFARELVRLGEASAQTVTDPTRTRLRDGDVPDAEADIRIVASANRASGSPISG